MVTPERILVIGATGNVGGALAARIAAGPAEIRAFVRNPATARLPAGVEPVRGDLTSPDTLHEALDGVDSVFLVWPLGSGELAVPVINTIAEHARRIVYLSSFGVRDDGADAGDPINQFHTELERAICGSGLEWTFLRSGGIATNTLAWAPQISAGDTVRWPYGKGTRALIHEGDLAEIGELALTTDAHVGAAYSLSGPTALTQIDQVQAIATAIGRPLTWVELSEEEATEQLLSWGWPRPTVEGALRGWAATVAEPEQVSSTFEDLTGHRGRTYQQWAHDHAGDFR